MPSVTTFEGTSTFTFGIDATIFGRAGQRVESAPQLRLATRYDDDAARSAPVEDGSALKVNAEEEEASRAIPATILARTAHLRGPEQALVIMIDSL